MQAAKSGIDFDRLIAGWRGPWLAALIAILAGLPGVFVVHPLDRDESRFAQATAQMLETGDWVNIEFQDQPRHKKPVGIHWLQAVTVEAVSSPEARQIWAYRIPSLLGAALAAFACAWGAAAYLGARGGFYAGAILATTFLLSTEAFIAKTDAVLTGSIVLAMAALGRMYLAWREGRPLDRKLKLVFWAALGVSILVKGPIGPMVAFSALAALAIWDRKVEFARKIGWLTGLALVALIVGPWAVAITVTTDGAFWGTAIGGDLAPKLTGGHERHPGPPGLHTVLVPLLFFPGSILLAAAAFTAWTRRAEPMVRFAICWFLPAFLIFEAAPTKLVHYPLPTYAALAWLAAAALTQEIGQKRRWAGAVLALIGAVGISAIAVYGLTEFGSPGDQMFAALTAGFALVGVFVAGFLLVRRATLAAVATALAFGVLAHGSFTLLLARLEPLRTSPRIEAALIRTGLDPRQGLVPGPVAIAGYAEPSLVFLLGTRTELLHGGAEGVDALREGRPVLIESRQQEAFDAALARSGVRARVVEVIEGYNYSNGDPVRITLYRAEPAR